MAAVQLIGMKESPFVFRVEFALKWKGIEYEFIHEDNSNKSPLLLKNNPVHKKVPVLIHNGNAIGESLVIIEYIDETWKDNPILPQDPHQRAMARFWAKFIDDKCGPAIGKAILGKAILTKSEEHEKAKVEASEVLEILNNELKDKKFFGGDNIGLADIAANFLTPWMEIFEEISGNKLITEEKYPKICKWIEEYLKCSIVKENIPDREILLAYFQGRFGSLLN